MEDLYIHIHCARENGISPVVAQMESAGECVSQNNENLDSNGLVNPTNEESSGHLHEFDINSLQFTNKKTEQVYVSLFFKSTLWENKMSGKRLFF